MINHEDMHGFLNTLKLNLLLNFKTGDPGYDMILSTILVGLITYLFANLNNIFEIISIKEINKFFRTYFANKIIIEGKRTFKHSNWGVMSHNIWSKKFDAIWNFINKNLTDNKDINSLKEILNTFDSSSCEERNNTNSIYILNDPCRSYLLDKKESIYLMIEFSDNNNDSEKMIELTGKVETITIQIYSYKKTVFDLKKYIDNLTDDYLKNIEYERRNKLFIYTLQSSNHDDEVKYKEWMERQFKSTRKFDNLYFDGKEKLIDKINFFLNNKEWYEKEGHPYTLGIGLSGPPGTGKTSIIKCIANCTKRHLIQIPLNNIKTEEDFYRYYFESSYNENNKKGSISFEKKIIVLEDIDCMSDIILSRKFLDHEKDEHQINSSDNNNQIEVIESFVNVLQDQSKNKLNNNFSNYSITNKSNKITLSFILNILDGLDENYGRILIISSNFYNKIDEALIRPGRIDLKLEMTKASKKTISDMFHHYFNQKLSSKYLSQMKENIVSPAEIVNIYRTTSGSKEFINEVISKCNDETNIRN